MNARSRFSQSSIRNGHTAWGPTKRTVVREKRRRRIFFFFFRNNAQLAVQYSIGPCLKVWYCHRPALFDCRLHSGMDQYMPVYRSSPEWCSTAGASLFRIISTVISSIYTELVYYSSIRRYRRFTFLKFFIHSLLNYWGNLMRWN